MTRSALILAGVMIAGTSSVVGTSETQSMTFAVSSFGRGFDSRRLHHHGDAPVSTGNEIQAETADRRPSQMAQTNTRRIRVQAGGLNRLVDVGSPRHQNRSFVLESSEPGKWETWTATAYGHGCTCSRWTILKDKVQCLPDAHKPRRGANGEWPTKNLTVATDRSYAFGTVLQLSFEGITDTRVVGDVGGGGRKWLDLFMGSECKRAEDFGIHQISVRILRVPMGGVRNKKRKTQ